MTPSFLAVDGADPRVRAVPIRLRRLVVSAALALFGVLLLPLHAGAHAYLMVSSPRTGQRLPVAPAGLQLLFTEPVALAHSGVQLFDEHFRLVPGTAVRVSATGTSISMGLPTLANGDYAAVWTVISADDGHITDGTIAFSVGPAPTAGSAATTVVTLPGTGGGGAPSADDQPSDWVGTGAAWLLLVGLALAGGGLAAERALAAGGGGRAQLSSRYLIVGMAIALVGAVIAYGATAGRLHGGSAVSGLDPRSWGAALGVRVGLEDAASIALLLNAVGALLLLRDRLVTLGSLAGAMVLVGMRSHPASASPWGEAAIVIHVVVALLWGGALAYLVRMMVRSGRASDARLSGVLERYARLALLSVLAIVLTGSAAALTQIASPGQLAATTYGRVLLIKIAMVSWTLAVAGLGRWRGLRRGRADAAAVRNLLRAEVVGLLLVLLSTAALANVAPPAPPLGIPVPVAASGAATVLLMAVGAAVTAIAVVLTVPMLRRRPPAM